MDWQEAESIVEAALPSRAAKKISYKVDNSEMLSEDDDAKAEMNIASLSSAGSSIENIVDPRQDSVIEQELKRDEEVCNFPRLCLSRCFE